MSSPSLSASGARDSCQLVPGEVTRAARSAKLVRTLLVGELRKNTEGMSSEQVALGLQKRSGKALGAVAVEEGEGGREGRRRDSPKRALRDNAAPAGLSLVDCAAGTERSAKWAQEMRESTHWPY